MKRRWYEHPVTAFLLLSIAAWAAVALLVIAAAGLIS